jgi:hypothetical protein
MKLAITTAMAAALFLTLGACKQEAAGPDAATDVSVATGIDGTWVADVASAKFDSRPDEVLLKDGTYSCSTCTPALTVKADGAFHPVTGRPYADSVAVKVDSDSQVTQTARKGERVIGTTTYSVSPDGNTLTVAYTDSSVEGGKPVTGKFTQTRVGDAPAGAHAISGKWKTDRYDNVSAEGLTVTYKVDGDTLHMSSPDGTSYDAKLDGTDAPIKGDSAGTTVSATRTGDKTYQFVSKRDGKVLNTTDITIDGALMHAKSKSEQDGSSMSYDAKRQ